MNIAIENGNRGVRIETSSWGLDFSWKTNGVQWTSFGVDDEMLTMIKDAINQYFETQWRNRNATEYTTK